MRVLNPVQNVHDAVDFADRLGDLRRPCLRAVSDRCENSLIWIGSGAEVKSPIMSCKHLHEFDIQRGFLLLDRRRARPR